MKKVLIITYYWPPSGGAGVQRWLKFAKYLPEHGWMPIIYTPSNPEHPVEDKSLFKDIRNDNLVVIKRPIWEPYKYYKLFTGKKTSEKVQPGFLNESPTNNIIEKFARWLRGNLFIPDARVFWIKPSINFLIKLLKNNPVDLIVSTGPPHSMHLIGMGLKQRFDIPWLTDFRDPWTQIDFYQHLMLTSKADKKHKKLEKTVLEKADCITTVGSNCAKGIKNVTNKDVHVITNGYDTDDFQNCPAFNYDFFSITHIGSMNKDRNPKGLWKALRRLIGENPELKNKLKIRFVGKTDYAIFEDLSKNMLSEYVENHNYLPHDKALVEASRSALLLLPINNTQNIKGIVTGKLFEYIALKRPILCLGDKEGDAASILYQTEGGKAFGFEDIDEIKNYLEEKFSEFKKLSLEVNPKNTERYSRDKLTGDMVGLFKKLV